MSMILSSPICLARCRAIELTYKNFWTGLTPLAKYVLSQRVDRATRGGADHLFWFGYELKRRGIKMLFPGDGLPDNVPFKNTLVAAKADAAQETASSTGQRSAQGSQYALEGRRISAHSRTPFGCYRLFCRADGTPLHVIVDKRNGLQEKRSWPELNLIDTYGTIGGGKVGHYKKQKSELVFLVLGDPYEQETVIIIFTMRYLEGRSARKIAQYLNALGRPAPIGGKWAEGQVSNIYNNEDYTTVAIANRKSAARYFRRNRKGPQKVEHDDITLTMATSIKPTIRDREDWHEGNEPHLIHFLKDENLRQIAMAKQAQMWERRLDPTWTPKNKKKRTPGAYLLYPLLRARQDGQSLVGSSSGTSERPVRVYRHKRAKKELSSGSIYGRVFNADVLEKAVLNVLSEILRDWPELEPRLLSHVQNHISLAAQDDDTLKAKEQQRVEVREQLLLYVRTLTPKTQADLAPVISRLESHRDALDSDIEMLKKQHAFSNIDPKHVVATLKDRLKDLADAVPTLPPVQLMDVLASLTERLEADMETKDVGFAFHLPTWIALSDSKNAIATMCTGANQEFSVGLGTHRDPSLFLQLGDGTCRFTYPHHQSVECHSSRSSRRAA